METQTRIGIGATALFALIGIFLLLPVPGWVLDLFAIACGVVAVWGFMPIFRQIFERDVVKPGGHDLRLDGLAAPKSFSSRITNVAGKTLSVETSPGASLSMVVTRADPKEEFSAEFIPLKEAARIAYEKIDGSALARKYEETARSPGRILRLVMIGMCSRGLVWGEKFPSTIKTRVSAEDCKKMTITEDERHLCYCAYLSVSSGWPGSPGPGKARPEDKFGPAMVRERRIRGALVIHRGFSEGDVIYPIIEYRARAAGAMWFGRMP